ncbi:hypothetical protein RBB50_004253 [Rhinocladiella similis]
MVRLPSIFLDNPGGHIFWTIASQPKGHEHGGNNAQSKPDRGYNLCARAPEHHITWNSVHEHLTWKKTPTPFISFLSTMGAVQKWEELFIQAGAYRDQISCYLTESPTMLLDANELAREIERNVMG